MTECNTRRYQSFSEQMIWTERWCSPAHMQKKEMFLNYEMIVIKCVMYCNYMTVCECRPLTGLFLIEGRSHVHSHSGASVSSSPRCEQATADASLPSLFYSSLNPFFPSYSSAVLTFSWNFLHSFAHFIILDGNIQASCTVKQTLQKSFRAVTPNERLCLLENCATHLRRQK